MAPHADLLYQTCVLLHLPYTRHARALPSAVPGIFLAGETKDFPLARQLQLYPTSTGRGKKYLAPGAHLKSSDGRRKIAASMELGEGKWIRSRRTHRQHHTRNAPRGEDQTTRTSATPPRRGSRAADPVKHPRARTSSQSPHVHAHPTAAQRLLHAIATRRRPRTMQGSWGSWQAACS